MEALYPSGIVVPINTEPLIKKYVGGYATGLASVKCKIRRSSDGFVLDWDIGGDRTFVDPTGAVNQLLQAMPEFNQTTFPGEYLFELDLSTITNVQTYDVYSISIVEDGTTVVSNLPQTGQFRIASALDNATLARKALYNDNDLTPGSTNNLELKDDDAVTPLARWHVQDKDGLGIGLSSGVPAIRRRVL